MSPFGHPMRAAFALRPGFVQLNHGSFGGTPREVLRAQQQLRDAMEADPVGFMLDVPARLRAILDRLAPHLGARGRDLVFVDNATTGVATVLRHLRLRPGDRIVTTTHVYGAVREILKVVAARTGAVVEEVVVPFPIEGPAQVVDAVTARLPGARLAVLDAITSATGLVLPIAALVTACRTHGVPVLVDAAHAPFHVPVDLDALGADWWVGNLHKWGFAAKGTAVLHVRPDRQDLEPLVPSHLMPQGYPHSFDWSGTRDFTPWLAVPAALRFLGELGVERVQQHNRETCAEAAAQLCEAWGVVMPSPPSMRAALATLPLPAIVRAGRASELQRTLHARGYGVVCAPFAGRTWLRISAQVYNTPEEYAGLAVVVREVLACGAWGETAGLG
jgi:isopenicillin-N epimerase